jgi:chromosome partitioning protein
MDETKYEDALSSDDKGTIYDIFVPSNSSIPNVLKQKTPKKPLKVIYRIKKGLDLIPSHISIIDFIDQRKSGSERLLNNYLKKIKSKYDFILIDCPPTSTILSRAAYLSSDAYLIPMGMDYFSVMGLPLLQKDINEFSETYGAELEGIGIVKTRFLDWTKVSIRHKRVVETFAKQLNLKIFKSSFRQRQDVQNALSDRKFLIDFNPQSGPARDIKAITKEFLSITGE